MCESHSPGEAFWVRRLMIWVYSKWVDDTLGFYLFLGKMGKTPLVGRAVRYFAGQYGKYLHGGRVAMHDEALEVLSRARSITVIDCACRVKHNRCDKPLRTCIAINTGAEVQGQLKKQEFISLEKAKAILTGTSGHGLIKAIEHCVAPNQYVICNCCTCCCVPYRLRTDFGIRGAMENGAYSARLDSARCRKCYKCLERCPEKAVDPDHGFVDEGKCLGCGLCIDSCRHGALKMAERTNPVEVTEPGRLEKFVMYTAFFTVIFPLALVFKLFRI